jgi:pilus assembly protein CpaB
MSRRRRAIVLLGLALALGGLAASDVARREAAVEEQLGPLVPVVVARSELPPGEPVRAAALTVRRVPARFAPSGTFGAPGELAGARTAIRVEPGTDLTASALDEGAGANGVGAPVRSGERVAEIVALGSPELVVPGSRVDVLVTREPGQGAAGGTTVALEDVEVLRAAAAADAQSASGDASPHVSASLRVSLRQAVYLAAAQSFARELRVLPRAAGDRRRGAQGLRVGGRL